MEAKRISSYPIKIEITLTTEEEAKIFYHLFNLSDFNKQISPINDLVIRDALGHELHDHDFHTTLWGDIKEALKK